MGEDFTRGPVRSGAQFTALVKKNFTLKTRGILCCCTAVEVCLPVFFLALLCLPKVLVKDVRQNDSITKPYALSTRWEREDCVPGYKLLVSPNSPEAIAVASKAVVNFACDAARSSFPDIDPDVMRSPLAKILMCNTESVMAYDPALMAALTAMGGNETSGGLLNAACSNACLRDATCFANAWGSVVVPGMISSFATKAAALEWTDANPGRVLALVAFDSGVAGSAAPTSETVKYSIFTNTTGYAAQKMDSELTREKFAERWESEATNDAWRRHANFVRIQNAVDAALIDEKDTGVEYSVTLDVSVKPYPWLGYDYNLGGIIAASVFAILGSLAFMSNVVIIMKSVVVEKELRLREGMQMMGMSSNMYWISWFFTHWVTCMITVVMLVLIGIYPFEHTDAGMQLIFYTAWVTSIILWNYMISTVFSRSISASVVGCFIYVISIAPSIAVRITAPDGGPSWLAACLLPGSSINMWGNILARMEVAKEGITFANASININKVGNFSAAVCIGMVILDCFIYAFLTWYLDKVWPTEFGQRLEPWFLFTKTYWFGESADDVGDDSSAQAGVERGDNFEPLTQEQVARASVKVRNLKKTFKNGVTAVDDLTVTFVPGQVSALLGHNGAGKTTTINILTGMMNQTSGDALINGLSIKTEMSAIRASLGICPQFDVLWPTLSVKEHLELYAAFAGMPKHMIATEVEEAVKEVSLSEKLNYPTGKLSGGQKRKLSLAISFIGRPTVVFLDEPTSGMDPYSRRFTWEVIRKRASTCSIMLTTHFLDEADLLCDRVAIMSAGKLACVGSPVFLKNRYGAGYHLTLARAAESNSVYGAEAVMALITRHLPDTILASDVGAELSFTLPADGTAKFATLFQELDGRLDELGFTSYGISCTTLEEVFLSIARGGVGGAASSASKKNLVLAADASKDQAWSDKQGAKGAARKETTIPLMEDDDMGESIRAGYVTGFTLLQRQMRGLLWKRYLNWRRDAWSILIQIVVPVLFFVLALFMATLSFTESTEFKAFDINRALLGDRPTIVSTHASDTSAAAVLAQWATDTATVRAFEPMLDCSCNCPMKSQDSLFGTFECCMYNQTTAAMKAAAVGIGSADDFCTSSMYAAANAPDVCSESSTGMDIRAQCKADGPASFDGYLWVSQEARRPCNDQGIVGCDALHIEGYNNAAGRYTHTVYVHQSAYHSIPATVNSANSAILRTRTGKPGAGIEVVNEWLPVYKDYKDGDIEDTGNDSTFVTSLFIVMGAAVLTSSIAVFPVYERRNNSKHLQMVSGINKVAYWICHWTADLVQMTLPLAAIMVIFAAFNIEQYRGELDGVFVLVLCFILSSIPYTHLIGFYFENEFYAFIGQVGMKLFLGVLATSTGMVLEAIKDLNKDTKLAEKILSKMLPIIIPHYSLGKGLYDLGQNRLNANRKKFDVATMTLVPVGVKPWSGNDVIGDDIGFLLGLGLFYAIMVLVIELSEGYISTLFARLVTCNLMGGNSLLDDGLDTVNEDEDVASERQRVQGLAASGFSIDQATGGTARDNRDGVILDSISKTFGVGSNRKKAVRSLAVGMPRGQCFGLLGINGAGKTSTFRMITGEFAPTSGDTRVLVTGGGKRDYLSIIKDLSKARAVMGYCPQFDGLQPNMTGKEHLQFYAQVRGVPTEQIDGIVESLIEKMALRKYADRQAGTYSGGNKRKLSVAIALIGEPAVVLLDEPSTGMDPEARRFMWDVISASTAGRTIVLTSHSMEECEALCNRIGIMVGGRFSCLGSLQHLKNRFSEGYSIDLRFEAGRGEAIFNAIVASGIPAVVVERHETELKLQVQDATTKLWQIFSVIESMRGTGGAAPPVEHVEGAPPPAPAPGGRLIDDYSVSQTTLEQVFVRFAADQNEEKGAAPGLEQAHAGLAQAGTFKPGGNVEMV